MLRWPRYGDYSIPPTGLVLADQEVEKRVHHLRGIDPFDPGGGNLLCAKSDTGPR